MASLTQWTSVLASSRNSERQGSLVCCSPWGHKSPTRLRDRTMTNKDIQGGFQNNNNTWFRERYISYFNNYNLLASLILCSVNSLKASSFYDKLLSFFIPGCISLSGKEIVEKKFTILSDTLEYNVLCSRKLLVINWESSSGYQQIFIYW